MNIIRSRFGPVVLVFLGIAAFFLVTEHKAHLFGILPYLLLLACPLLHWLLHGGNAGHGSDHKHSPEGDKNG